MASLKKSDRIVVQEGKYEDQHGKIIEEIHPSLLEGWNNYNLFF